MHASNPGSLFRDHASFSIEVYVFWLAALYTTAYVIYLVPNERELTVLTLNISIMSELSIKRQSL